MPTLLTIFLACAIAVLFVYAAAIFVSIGFLLFCLRDMAICAGRESVAAWRRRNLRGWRNRLLRRFHRRPSCA